MKILILTASNPTKTAGIVALDLQKALSAVNNNEVRILAKVYDKYTDKNIIAFDSWFTHYKNLILRKSKNLFVNKLKLLKSSKNKTDRDYSVQDYDQTVTYYSTQVILKKANFTPDVILVLFMPKFLSFKNLYELNYMTNAPIFLYMMDMAPMTGGCHYAWDCNGYLDTCGNCPALYSTQENDQSRKNWEFKKGYVEKTNITAIAGTEWQYRQLLRSSLYKNVRKEKVILGVSPETFKPGDKSAARKALGIPMDKKILFFGATGITQKRKGLNQLTSALRKLKNDIDAPSNIHLVIAARVKADLFEDLPFNNTFLGFLDHISLATAFQAADIFICPSIEDSGPMMINQSIMCGTPVVAFEMGAALDLVITGKTGYRARLGDSHDLAIGIKSILDLGEQEYRKMSKNCRELAISICDKTKQAEVFMKIYEAL